MNKKLIRLTESDLHQIVKESVNKILNELDYQTYMSARDKAAERMDNPSLSKDARNKAYNQHKAFDNAMDSQLEKQYNLSPKEVMNARRGEYGKQLPSYTDAPHIARRDRMDDLRKDWDNSINGRRQYRNGMYQ